MRKIYDEEIQSDSLWHFSFIFRTWTVVCIETPTLQVVLFFVNFFSPLASRSWSNEKLWWADIIFIQKSSISVRKNWRISYIEVHQKERHVGNNSAVKVPLICKFLGRRMGLMQI